MIKSIRVQLLPNNKQKTKLFQFAGAARYAYNWALNKQMDNFREGHKIQTDNDLRKVPRKKLQPEQIQQSVL